jgi:von Willebrand factor type A domain
MLRSSLRMLLFLAVIAWVLPVSCKGIPGTEEALFEFGSTYDDPFDTLRGRAWQSFIRQGGRNPMVENGLLVMTTVDKGFGVARSIVKLRKQGYYHTAQAAMRVSGIDDGAHADLEFGFSEGENEDLRTARWRVTYSEADDRWTLQPLILDEDQAVLLAGPTAPVAADTWHTYRIDLDTLRGTISFNIDGSLHFETTRSEMYLDKTSELAIGNFIGGKVEVDDFSAERLSRTAFVTVEQVRTSHRIPSRVEVLFSLRDVADLPVVVSSSDLEAQLSVEALEDGAPLDLQETEVHLRGAADLDLDLVLVLDYTESMRTAGDGTGIDVMKQAALQLIFDRAPAHRIAVVEFHDNLSGDNFSTLIDFTTDKNAAWAAVRDYQPFNGFSTAWDAVDQGLNLFPATVDLGRIKMLAFLSDGFDTSSTQQPQNLIDLAIARDVTIFNVGIEDVRGVDELELTRISDETGGRYFRAEQIADLLTHFDSIDDELAGQYKAAYVTPRSDSFGLTMWVTHTGNLALEPISMTVDGAAILGDSREGLITAGPASTSNQVAEFYFTAQHIPRRIGEIRFQFDTTGLPITQGDLQVNLAEGPLDGWTLTQQPGDWYSATGPDLGFGDFGPLFQVDVTGVSQAFDLPFTFDNSLYPSGVLFFGGDAGELVNGDWQSMLSIPGP